MVSNEELVLEFEEEPKEVIETEIENSEFVEEIEIEYKHFCVVDDKGNYIDFVLVKQAKDKESNVIDKEVLFYNLQDGEKLLDVELPSESFIKPKWENNKWIETATESEIREREVETQLPIEDLKENKLHDVGMQCTQTIEQGIEFEGYHYSLTDYDQLEILKQAKAIEQGAVSVPYHANGELVDLVSADIFLKFVNAVNTHIFKHRTYCNHLNIWIRRETDRTVLESINYTDTFDNLPVDLSENIQKLLS